MRRNGVTSRTYSVNRKYLRPRQVQFLAWAKIMEQSKLKGILLVDDMGLGNTISALAHLSLCASAAAKDYLSEERAFRQSLVKDLQIGEHSSRIFRDECSAENARRSTQHCDLYCKQPT